MRWTGHGHEAIRATHHKTLELTGDPSITERATCIVAVGAEPSPNGPSAGPVEVTIGAGGHSFAFEALANPNWDPAGPAVIRRSPFRLPGTFATDATAAAGDLPRELVAALADPTTTVTVRVEPIRHRRAVVLFAADAARGEDPRLAAELAVADTVLAEDRAARELVGRQPGGRTDGRTLVVATVDLPGITVALDESRTNGLPIDRMPIETVGLPARLAVAAACPSRARLVLAADDADPRHTIRGSAAADRVVVRVAADRLEAVLLLAEQERGSGVATIAQEYAQPLRVAPAAMPALSSRDVVYCCLHPANGTDALDPAVRAAIAALLADGVSTRTASRALAELAGMPRRRAYDAVVAMAHGSPANS